MLKRAVMSIRRSSQAAVRIIVVVNGRRHDPDTCAWLRSQQDVTLELLDEPSLPNALRRGVSLVDSEYFSTLDDDDEYVGLATDSRQVVMDADPRCDVVISNGVRCLNGVDVGWYEGLPSVPDNPLLHLMRANWLTSCNALYRRSSIDETFFSDMHKYAEWTWLGFRIAMANKRIAILDQPTFRINDTPGSLSKSAAFDEAYVSLFRRMLDLGPPRPIQKLIRKKLGAAYHDASNGALARGAWYHALALHARSLVQPSGLAYLPYTRYFLLPSKLGRQRASS